LSLELKVAIGVLILLSVALIAQQVFWLVMVHRFVNKLLSRNYAEYVQTEMIKSKAPVRNEPSDTKEPIDDFSLGQAERANTMFGFGGGVSP
jgi:hypothetical protein